MSDKHMLIHLPAHNACLSAFQPASQVMPGAGSTAPRLSRKRSRAFSFAEVMFAVVILGIGFIMVAAVFPVAIHQTASSGEENTASAAARTAAAAIASLPTTPVNPYRLAYPATPYIDAAIPATISVFPPTVKNYWIGTGTGIPTTPPQTVVAPPAVMVPFVGTRGDMLNSSIIQNTDPRYSYVAFYKRENNSSVAELVVVAVANRVRPIYDSTDLSNSSKNQTTATVAVQSQATPAPPTQKVFTTIYPDTATVTNVGSGLSPAEGCTVGLTVNPIITTTPPFPAVYRSFMLGRLLSSSNPSGPFELNPGDGITVGPNTQTGLWGDVSYASTTTPYNYQEPRHTDYLTQLSGNTLVFNKVSTLQATTAYVMQIKATTAYPNGQIMLSSKQMSLAAQGVNAFPPAAAVPGAFVIIADDCPYDYTGADGPGTNQTYPIPPNTAKYQVGRLNGRIFRLGAQIVQDTNGSPLSGVFQLDPAYGMQPGSPDQNVTYNPAVPTPLYGPDTFPSPYMPMQTGGIFGTSGSPAAITARCYIIGAGKDASGINSGGAQDLGVFVTYFQAQ